MLFIHFMYLFLQCVTICDATSSGWNSAVQSISSQSRSLSIRWSPDYVMSTANYSVQYRLRASLDSYTMQNVRNVVCVCMCVCICVFMMCECMIHFSNHFLSPSVSLCLFVSPFFLIHVCF